MSMSIASVAFFGDITILSLLFDLLGLEVAVVCCFYLLAKRLLPPLGFLDSIVIFLVVVVSTEDFLLEASLEVLR
jgi:hypothetical protein